MTLLTAVLIVRNEAAVLSSCLSSLADVVDAIHVHDTGSTDETIAIAERFGAVVTQGKWTDDFAAARNAALVGVDSEWVLSIDADETLIADGPRLREALERSDDIGQVMIRVEHDENPYDFPANRLFRPARIKWEGAVHEQLVSRDGTLSTVFKLEPEVATITHHGYATSPERNARARRNVDLAQQVVDSSDDDTAIARALIDVGRSNIALGEKQAAADAFELTRTRFPNTPEWLEATDFLTRLVLSEEMPNETLVLVNELASGGAQREYCDWLAAQALVGLSRFKEANELLQSVSKVIDTSGREHSAAALDELKSIVAQLAAQ